MDRCLAKALVLSLGYAVGECLVALVRGLKRNLFSLLAEVDPSGSPRCCCFCWLGCLWALSFL